MWASPGGDTDATISCNHRNDILLPCHILLASASHKSHPHSRAGITRWHKHQLVEIMGSHLEFAPHTALPGLGLDLSWVFRNLSPLAIGNRDFFQGSLKFLDPSGDESRQRMPVQQWDQMYHPASKRQTAPEPRAHSAVREIPELSLHPDTTLGLKISL